MSDNIIKDDSRNFTLPWPPPFVLQHSKRRRSVQLKICARKGLQLMVPAQFNPQKALRVLEKHRHWIERTWRRVQPFPSQLDTNVLPQHIAFPALRKQWEVHYNANEKKRLSIEENADTLIVSHGKIHSPHKIKHFLQRWLQQKAKEAFIPWLKQLSDMTNFTYYRVNIRNNASRWGSCSARKNISLNCKLLFLHADLVNYVLLHELCHTTYLNHSKLFWELLKKFSPDENILRKKLRQAHREIPLWVDS